MTVKNKPKQPAVKTALKSEMKAVQVPIKDLKAAAYNPRRWTPEAKQQLTESITRYGLVEPIVVNAAPARKNIVIGGHFRMNIAKELGYVEVPVVYVNIPDIAKEKELNLRLNKNVGEFDFTMLKDFDEELLKDVGFNDFEINLMFGTEVPEEAKNKPESSRENTISTVIVFDTEEQREVFNAFCVGLKEKYQTETIAQAIVKHIEEQK